MTSRCGTGWRRRWIFSALELGRGACEPVARSFFDNLDILPLWLWLLARRRSPAALIGGNLSPGVEQGGSIVAFAIGCHVWRRLGMPTLFELRHQLMRHLFLGLANRTSDAQA